MSLDSGELSNSLATQQVVMRVVAWASEPKCARIRQVTRDATTADSSILEMCSGDITAVNPRENRGNGDNFCEITAVITGMGTALTGIPR